VATRPFAKLLVANRGEIAVRIFGTARSLGYSTVAVHSDADEGALHVREADEAVRIGPPPVSESYLSIENILDAAKRTGVDAIHPGYGFLAENADFAAACEAAGIVFIGPGAEAIRAMGNKRVAKQRMRAANVPCVPGYDGEDQSDAALIAEAKKIGFPIMVKAAAGGGGRGMRRVESAADLGEALRSARSEAKNAFGDDELLVEKLLVAPRHVEIQVVADSHGTTIHLGERECSVQRRHQKVIEEAPSPAVDATLRATMGAAAVRAAQAIGYVNAGTVEFLLDDDGAFYFMEMNTRLQVEHPVTELVTGVDLVELQLRVAAGERLQLSPDVLEPCGWAIEARLYAEDPAAGFLPDTGSVRRWIAPVWLEGVRVDPGICEGGEVSAFYDPMLAKVIAAGQTREEARRRLSAALRETRLLGVRTNKQFLRALLETVRFRSGATTTDIVGELLDADGRAATAARDPLALALAAVVIFEAGAAGKLDPWRSTPATTLPIRVSSRGEERVVALTPAGPGSYAVELDGTAMKVTILERSDSLWRVAVDGVQRRVAVAAGADGVWIDTGDTCERIEDLSRPVDTEAAADSDGRLAAPMAGRIVSVDVEAGDPVTEGKTMIVLEAMKIEHQIAAPFDGTVAAVSVEKGDQVAARQLLVEVEPSRRGQ
jgi:geranyl-CoA carboxylase alpha subunit